LNPVDLFGNMIEKNFEKRPILTRSIIRVGYAAQQMLLNINPNQSLLPSQQYLAKICMKYTRKPLQRPESSALVNLFFPCELLHAMDIAPQCVEGFSAFLCGGKGEHGYLKFAEEKGVPDTYCSYHKALLGAVFSGTVPKPRFILTTNTICDANTTTFDAIARHFDMTRVMIDVPFERTPDAVQYVTEQLEQLITFLEDELGRKMNPERLRKAVMHSNAATAAHQEYLTELQDKFVPTSATVELYRILCSHILMGSSEAQAFYEHLLSDSRTCEESSGKRILWCHVLPFYSDSLKKLFLDREGVQLLVSDLTYDSMLPLDEQRPLQSMACRLIDNNLNGPLQRRCDSVLKMTRRLHADGVVLFCHWGCKQNNGGVFGLQDSLQKAGIKTIILDGDGCDRSNMSQGQFDTRLQAFLEMLEDKI